MKLTSLEKRQAGRIEELESSLAEAREEIRQIKQKEIDDDVRWMQLVAIVESIRMNAIEHGMIAGLMDKFDEVLDAKGQNETLNLPTNG